MNQNGNGQKKIEVKNLWKVFGNRPERVFEPEFASMSRSEIQDAIGAVVGLRDVSFSVEPGQIFVIMGLSGSGKSTLIRCLIRLIGATRGEIRFDGEDILAYDKEELISFRRQKVAMVFQHYGLMPHRRVLDNVAYGLEIRGIEKEERYREAAKAIETVGLSGWEDYFPSEMSGGMQQRVGLARALAVNADSLMMDEPFSGLDPLIRRQMQDELISLQTDLKKTIVFITHDLNEALKVGDRIAIMRDGEIIQEGTPEDIVRLPADDYVTEFVQDVSKAKVIQARAIMREPAAVVYERQGPRAALHVMQSNELRAVFLIARDFTLRGVLTEDVAKDMAAKQIRSLENVNVTPAVIVRPETFIEEIIPIAAKSTHPIAVVGDNKSLLGEIRRAALLMGISDTA